MSVDYPLLRRLDHLEVGDDVTRDVVAAVCSATDTPEPRLRFHARRSPFTGMTEAPRHVVAQLVAAANPSASVDLTRVPEHGAIRLGRRSTLMTIAHELGHHLVHHHDPIGTPDHGNRWVLRFDQSAAVIAALVGVEGGPTTTSDRVPAGRRSTAVRSRRRP